MWLMESIITRRRHRRQIIEERTHITGLYMELADAQSEHYQLRMKLEKAENPPSVVVSYLDGGQE